MSFAFCNHADKEQSLTLCLGVKLAKFLLGEIVFLSQVRFMALFLWKTANHLVSFLLNFSIFESTAPDEVHEKMKSSSLFFLLFLNIFLLTFHLIKITLCNTF